MQEPSSVTIFDKKERQQLKYIPGRSSDKVINFTDEPVVWCDIPLQL